MSYQKGFAPLIIIVIVTLVTSAGIGGFLVFWTKKTPTSQKITLSPPPLAIESTSSQISSSLPIPSLDDATTSVVSPLPATKSAPTSNSILPLLSPQTSAPSTSKPNMMSGKASPTETSWNFFDDYSQVWRANENPPACPVPLKMLSPVNLSLVTGVLYPGQYRGNDYKTHGGFRFDNSTNNAIIIRAPMDAYISRASRYIQNGEIQYLFFFIAPCGIMYRFDHLLTLAPRFQTMAENLLPPAKLDDSRTTDISEKRITVKTGEIVATEIGLKTPQNVGVDFGVYDLRTPNVISKDLSWAKLHENSKEITFYALCHLDVLPEEDAARLRALPSGVEGKSSDYCQ